MCDQRACVCRVVADGLLAMPWAKILQQLVGDELPEGLHLWIANLKSVVEPLLQRTLELINVAMGNQEETAHQD